LPETQPEPPPGAGHGFGATAEPLRHCSRLRPGGAARATGTGRMAARSPKIARTTIARRGCGLLNRVTDSTSECVRPERSARRRCAQRSDGQARSIRTWRSGDAADNVGQPRSAGGRRGSPRRDPSPANPPSRGCPRLAATPGVGPRHRWIPVFGPPEGRAMHGRRPVPPRKCGTGSLSSPPQRAGGDRVLVHARDAPTPRWRARRCVSWAFGASPRLLGRSRDPQGGARRCQSRPAGWCRGGRDRLRQSAGVATVSRPCPRARRAAR
jgi:hypothetical protein